LKWLRALQPGSPTSNRIANDESLTSGKAGGLKTVNRSKRLVRFALKAKPPKMRKTFFICHLPFSIFHLKGRGLGDGLKS
jgi:hypothetical protein